MAKSLKEIAEKILGHSGKMLGSKSIYSYDHPNNVVVFNANVIIGVKTPIKVWHGDLDITKSLPMLVKLQKETGDTVSILYEMDARFEKEHNPDLSSYVVQLMSNKILYQKWYKFENNTLMLKTNKELKKEFPDMFKEPEKKVLNKKDYKAVRNFILPNIKRWKVSKKESPINKLQKHYIKKCAGNKDKAHDLYFKTFVSCDFYEHLRKLVTKWVNLTEKGLHPAKKKQTVGMYMLNSSPASLYESAEWVSDRYIYKKRTEA